jgi:mannose-6-phosphate isomerase-like protein (cupin superfamily)
MRAAVRVAAAIFRLVKSVFIRKLVDCKQITALDGTALRELLNPLHHGGELRLGYSLAHAVVKAGNKSMPHRLRTCSEVYYIVKGHGVMYVADEAAQIGPQQAIYIPPGAWQHLENNGKEDIEFLCIVFPSWHAEDEELA